MNTRVPKFSGTWLGSDFDYQQFTFSAREFFNLLTGVLPPSAGRVLFKGRDITGLPAHAVSRLGIARSYQVTNIFGDLTVFENVRIAAQSRVTHYRFWGNADSLAAVNARAEEILRHLGLAPKRHARASELSHGEQRYLEIGIALATDPDFLLLDEPTAGMSPDETQRTAAFVRRLAGHVTIVVVEHDMEVVMGISDRITVLNYGEILAEGSPAEIRDIPFVSQTDAISICLDQMTDNDAWPQDLQDDDSLANERLAVQKAVDQALAEDAKGDVSRKTMNNVTKSITALPSSADTIP